MGTPLSTNPRQCTPSKWTENAEKRVFFRQYSTRPLPDALLTLHLLLLPLPTAALQQHGERRGRGFMGMTLPLPADKNSEYLPPIPKGRRPFFLFLAIVRRGGKGKRRTSRCVWGTLTDGASGSRGSFGACCSSTRRFFGADFGSSNL